jgi:hypothetical protein
LTASTKKSDLERDKKTDVREIEKFLPVQKEKFDPKKYFKDDAFFIGYGALHLSRGNNLCRYQYRAV